MQLFILHSPNAALTLSFSLQQHMQGYQNAKWVDAELLEFSPGKTGGAELGVVFSLSQTHRFLVLFNRVDMDSLQQRIDAMSAPQI